MIRLDNLLKNLGGKLRQAGPPTEDPEVLAELHLKQAGSGAHRPALVNLFHAEAHPGEEDWRPSGATLARVQSLVVDPSPWRMVLRRVGQAIQVVSHTGTWLDPQPLAVRGHTEPRVATTHTFTQLLPPFRATVGLEAESDAHFGLTLTLDSSDAADPAIRATLWEGTVRRAVQSGSGVVCMEGLRAGTYRLEVMAEGRALGDIHVILESQESPGGSV